MQEAADMMKIIFRFFLAMLFACSDLRTHSDKFPPGYAMVILKRDGKMKKSFEGYADIKKKIKITSETKFRLASLTKAFTAMSILLLEQEGKIQPDDKVTKFLPELSPLVKDIRIKHLVHHTSGLPYFGELCHRGKFKSPVTNKEVLNWLKGQKTTVYPPGSKYEYSNTGYVVLAEVVSRISAKSFPEFVEQKIFLPLDMKNSTFITFDNESRIAKAHAYPDEEDSCNYTWGEDGIYTTLDDYIKWTRAITTNILLKEKFRRKIFQADGSYSYGWTQEKTPYGSALSHYGWWAGFRTHARYYGQDGIWIIVLSNYRYIPMEEIIKSAETEAFRDSTI